MQLADLTIDQPQQETQQLVRAYEGALDLDGTFVTAESQFERDSLGMTVEGWQLKVVSHRGSIVSPGVVVVATYEK